MSNEQTNVPIDPLIARVTLQRQHEIARVNAIDVPAAADEAWKNPDNLTLLGVDEGTATRVAKGIAATLEPTREPITELSQIFGETRLRRIEELEERAKSEAERPAIAKDFKPKGKPVIKHITQEQLRVELGLNGRDAKTDEQQVA